MINFLSRVEGSSPIPVEDQVLEELGPWEDGFSRLDWTMDLQLALAGLPSSSLHFYCTAGCVPLSSTCWVLCACRATLPMPPGGPSSKLVLAAEYTYNATEGRASEAETLVYKSSFVLVCAVVCKCARL
jgi:hypothetical protein